MYSKVIILLWERWQLTRGTVIVACMLPLIGRLMYVTGYYPALGNTITKTFVLLGFVSLTFVLLVGHCETRDVNLAFPKRLFRFPVRTTTLLAVYMGYGIVAVALPSLILFGFEKLFLASVTYKWTNLLILETVFIALQTLSWSSSPGHLLCLALWFAGNYVLHLLATRLNLIVDTYIICLIIIVLCGLISFWNVTTYRHGAWINGPQWMDSLLGIFRKRPSKPSASALHAQIWFELRQTGYLFPISALCLVGLILGYMVGLELYDKRFVVMAPAVPVALQVTIIAALFAGLLIFGVYHRDHVSGASIFWLRRPMSTRSLAIARLYAMAWSIARVLVILMVVTLAVAAHDYLVFGMPDVKALSQLLPFMKWAQNYSSPLETVTMTVLCLYGFVIFYWTILRLGPILAAGGVSMAFITWLMNSLIGDVAVSWMWNALAVGLFVVVLIAFYIARHRKLISTTTLMIAACLFSFSVVSIWTFPWWFLASKGLPDLNLTQIIRLISAATLPFIPVAVTPLLMYKLRHR